MAVTSVVKLSELEGTKRIDAEYYDQIFKVIEKINKFPVKMLYSISKIAYGTTPEGGKFYSFGVPFVRSQNFDLGNINDNELVYCDRKFHNQNLKSALVPGDILFAAVGGTIGQIAIVQSSLKEGNINQNIARVRIFDKRINPYYAGIFFMSKYGQLQIYKLVTGNAQPYLNSLQIGALKIPVLNSNIQNEIHKFFLDIEKYIIDSKTKYLQAESLLLSELGLQDLKLKDKLSYKVNLSEANITHRIDAEYFNPWYDEILGKIPKNIPLFLLRRVFDFRRGIFIPIIYYSEYKTERPYIRIKELSGKVGIDESKVIFIKDEYPENSDNKLYENDLVMAIIGDTIGKVNRITKELSGGYCSNNTGRLRIKGELQSEILPEFAEVLFQSIFIQSQIEKKKAPTGQPKISDNEIKTILVPILPIQTQQKIAKLVQESHEARRKAKQLLEEAKKKVEEYIEQEK